MKGLGFTVPMMLANRARKKTKTRRLAGLYLPALNTDTKVLAHQTSAFDGQVTVWIQAYGVQPITVIRAPHKVGDLFYCRESFCPHLDGMEPPYTYAADWYEDGKQRRPYDDPAMRWKSGRYMPAAAARYWGRVVDIRLERLQEITEGDAIDEGVRTLDAHWLKRHFKDCVRARAEYDADPREAYQKGGGGPLGPLPSQRFQKLWDSIHGKDQKKSWVSNPLVWVISYDFLDYDPTI